MLYTQGLSSVIPEIGNQISKQTEIIILEQLNDLISRNLLIVETTQPTFVTEYSQNSDKIQVKVMQQCRLVLKDKEYIEKLEKENEELKTILKTLFKNND